MKAQLIATTALLLCALPAAGQAASTSVYLKAPADPAAVTVSGVRGDGRTDDTAAIQAAIDSVAGQRRGGVVFLPSGRYRISRTVFIRSGVRILGVGPTRPVFVLADNTPGYQTGVAAMLAFTGEDQYAVGRSPNPPPTSVPANDKIWDATSTTFYSTISNVDFEVGAGNPAAVVLRQRTAQHGYVSHADFHLGSALAGIYQAGNVGEDLRFFGGRYGILTEKTSPAWQYTLVDSVFEGQRDAAIREHEVDLTLVNVAIRDTPVGVEIDEGFSDSLWGKDVRFENVSQAGVLISSEASAFTQVGFEGALARNTPTFARFRESGKTVAGKGAAYRVREFTYGLTLPGLGQMGRFETRADMEGLRGLPAPRARAVRGLPPVSQWVDVRSLGAKGDGTTDDTAAVQKAIDAHRVVYFPLGRYIVSDTIRLRADSVLIGLHPNLTQLVLPDRAPGYAGVGEAKALLESARGGAALVSGLGLFTGGVNPRASALIWKAGEGSQVSDVKIQGGGGTYMGEGKRLDMSDPPNRWDGQHPSIWVTDGGGGVFFDIWSPNTFAQAGFYVSNTKTPGHVYELSAEHHPRVEIVMDGVENWEFLAPQTEQEVRDGVDAVSTEIRNSKNILFANYHGYRVTRSIKPMDTAVRLFNSENIRFRNVHVNAESGFATCDDAGCGTFARASKYPFENAIKDMTHHLEVREREFAVLDVPAAPQTPAPASLAKVEKLQDGFFSISGATVDPSGKLYFVEQRKHRIWSWTDGRGLELVQDAPLDQVNLAATASGDLMVVSSAGSQGTVYTFKPGAPDKLTVLQPTAAAAAHPGAATALPVQWWVNGEFHDNLDPATGRFTTLAEMFARDAGSAKAQAYVSPDGSLVLPAYRVWTQGPADHSGYRWSHMLDGYGLVAARPGERVLVTNASENRTYSGVVGAGGALQDLKVFAERGGEGVATGPDGRVYVANGQVFVYGADGRELGRIDTPERPLQLVFGGPDRRTLYILSHHSLYAARP